LSQLHIPAAPVIRVAAAIAGFTPAAYGRRRSDQRPHHEVEEHMGRCITCTFIYSPTEATGGHTTPDIMLSSPRVNGGVDNVIDER